MDQVWSFLPLILEVAVPVVVVLIAWVIRALVKKLNIEKQVNADKLIDIIVSRVVDGVEKISEVAINKGEKALSGKSKLAAAVKLIRDEAQALGLPALTGEILRVKVEAYLKYVDSKSTQSKE